MKTIKSKIMDIYKEIGEDNSRDFSKRKYLKEYLGSVLINYRRKSDKKIVMKIYKSKSKKGTEIFIDNTVYFLTMVENIMVIYNEYGRAVSISFTDGYEWTGEAFISEDAIIEENSFRLKYQKFINETENSKDLKKLYNDSKNMLALLNETTFVCDTTKMYENIYSIYSYLDYCLHNNMDTYFNSKLDKVKDINKSLENYYQKEDEVEYALKALKDYYLWLIDIENLNRNRLNSQDKFFKIVNEMKEHINKLFNKMTISQSDWDLLDYYHEEIEKLISNKEIIKEKQP